MILENSRYPLDPRVRKEAESLSESGFAVEVLAPREPGDKRYEVVNGVTVRRFPLYEGHGTLLGTALEYVTAVAVVTPLAIGRILRSRFGILHVHNPPDLFFPLLWLARARGWRTVFDHHDDAAGMLSHKLGRSTAGDKTLSWMRRRSGRAADLTIVTNRTQQELLRDCARCSIIVRNCPPLWFADHRPAPPAHKAKLVFLGEIGAQDHVDRGIEILARLVHTYGLDVDLLVIGDGPRRTLVEDRAEDLKVAARLTITGWLPYEEVPRYLASAHVGIDTSPLTIVNHGSTMVKLLEYMAVGLPVVATALRETQVTCADAAIMLKGDDPETFAQAIAPLITDRATWLVAADAARQRGATLTWPAQAALLRDAYHALLSQPPINGIA